MRSILLVLALLPATAAAEPEDPFCAPLRQLAQGAAEAVPFQSLRESGLQRGLGSAYCSFNDAGGYTCGHNLARPEETRDNYAIYICVDPLLDPLRGNGRFEELRLRVAAGAARPPSANVD